MYLWILLIQIPLATVALIALGVLLHYSRRADQRGPTSEPGLVEGSPVPGARRQTLITRVASGILVLALVAIEIRGVILLPGYERVPYVLPLGAAVVALAVVAIGTARDASRPATAAGSSSPRMLMGWQVAIASAVTALLVITIVGAGALASDDEEGHSAALTIRAGSFTAGTQFLGWFYGVPMLVALLCLAAVVVVAVRRIARRSLEGADAAADLWLRRIGVRHVLTLATAATLFTLGRAWTSIAGSSGMTAGFQGPDGHMTLGTSIAALHGPLAALGTACEGIGLALALLPLFAAVPRRRTRPAPSATPLNRLDSGTREPETL